MCEEVVEPETPDLRGRLAGMLVFCPLDSPKDFYEFSEALEALLSYRAVEEPRTNWNNPQPGQRRLPETMSNITYNPTSRPAWGMTLRRIRLEAQTGLPLSQTEGEAFARAGLLPYIPLGSRTESILTAILSRRITLSIM